MATTADVSNAKLDETEFEIERRAVFAQAPTVLEPFSLDEAVRFHLDRAPDRNVALHLLAAKRAGLTLVQPRAGVGSLEGQRRLMRILADSGADIVPMTIDSMTRTLKFSEAASAAQKSTVERSLLNGYPIVAHGIQATRDLVLECPKPVHVRANATDLRLVAEHAFASGVSGFVSGPMYATLEYSKDVDLARSIRNWQYIFRLIGNYAEAGVPIAEDALGFTQSGSYSVPSLMHVGVVLDALIMAGQGVKHVIAYAISQGTLAQDIAACLAVGGLVDEYLKRAGFNDVEVYVSSNHWNGSFPTDEAEAYGLIALNTLVGALAKCQLIYVKSIEEGVGVPTAEGNAASVRATKYVVRVLADQIFGVSSDEVAFELELNLIEARAILDAVLDLGHGDAALGAVRAFQAGVLDVPFSPSRVARGDVLVVRDVQGAVRFLDPAGIPLPARALKMEADRLALRAHRIGRPVGYDELVADLHWLAGDE